MYFITLFRCALRLLAQVTHNIFESVALLTGDRTCAKIRLQSIQFMLIVFKGFTSFQSNRIDLNLLMFIPLDRMIELVLNAVE